MLQNRVRYLQLLPAPEHARMPAEVCILPVDADQLSGFPANQEQTKLNHTPEVLIIR